MQGLLCGFISWREQSLSCQSIPLKVEMQNSLLILWFENKTKQSKQIKKQYNSSLFCLPYQNHLDSDISLWGWDPGMSQDQPL